MSAASIERQTGPDLSASRPAASSLPLQPRYSIRDAALSDAHVVTEIYNDSVEAHPSTSCRLAAASSQHAVGGCKRQSQRGLVSQMSVEAVHDWIARHAEFGRKLWLACDGTKPVGWLSFMGLADRPGMSYTSELAVYVGAGARAAGVGTELLSAALREAPSMGFDCLIAMVWSDNDASQHLFRRHGFVPWGKLPSAVWAYGASRDMLVVGRHVIPAVC